MCNFIVNPWTIEASYGDQPNEPMNCSQANRLTAIAVRLTTLCVIPPQPWYCYNNTVSFPQKMFSGILSLLNISNNLKGNFPFVYGRMFELGNFNKGFECTFYLLHDIGWTNMYGNLNMLVDLDLQTTRERLIYSPKRTVWSCYIKWIVQMRLNNIWVVHWKQRVSMVPSLLSLVWHQTTLSSATCDEEAGI